MAAEIIRATPTLKIVDEAEDEVFVKTYTEASAPAKGVVASVSLYESESGVYLTRDDVRAVIEFLEAEVGR